VELLHPVVVVLAGLWAVGRAAAAVSGELDRGTLELLLSQPVPRNRLILAHFLVDVVVIPCICLSIVAGTRVGLETVGPFVVDYSVLDKLPPPARLIVKQGPAVLTVSADRQIWAVVCLASLMFALSGLTMLVSALGRNRWRTLGVAALIAVGMFVANVVGQLWDGAAWVRPWTLFFYYQPQKVWLHGDWLADLSDPWGPGWGAVPAVPVLAGVGAAGYLLALWVFTRRDLPAPL
jgi:ABC-2 type transport system permease protein